MKWPVYIIPMMLFACHNNPQPDINRKTNDLFNDGVAINLKSIDEQNKGNYDSAAALNKQSIVKFKELLQLDSTYPAARGALAHCLYIDGQFDEAITWFKSDLTLSGETPYNDRELGLCQLYKGNFETGKAAIDRAFLLDTTRTIRILTIQDLKDVAENAKEFGEEYTSAIRKLTNVYETELK